MTTKDTIEQYFDAIHAGGWESFIADDFVFVVSNLDNVAHGKAAYLEGAGQFFSTTTAVDIRQMLVDPSAVRQAHRDAGSGQAGENVAVLARYDVRNSKGSTSVCDVAEFLTVEDGKLTSSAIFFDTNALTEFMAET